MTPSTIAQRLRSLADEIDKDNSEVLPVSNSYKVKELSEQIKTLRGFFLKLEKPQRKDRNPLPEGMDGFFAIPKWQKIGKTYNEAVEIVLEKIGSQRRFKNWREGQLGEEYLRQTLRKSSMMDKLAARQRSDILFVPAQFGGRHRRKSVKWVRDNLAENEIPFGAYEVGIMLLTHPERLVKFEDIWLDCPGDEYDFDVKGQCFHAPVWGFYDGELGFYARKVDSPHEGYGSVSGLLPE